MYFEDHVGPYGEEQLVYESAAVAPAKRHLTDDEEVSLVAKRGSLKAFRVRVWRAVNATPVVLASPCLGSDGAFAAPSAYTSKIANYANESLAGYPESSILYFQTDSVTTRPPKVEQVHFEYFGNQSRLRLFKPIISRTSWGRLESLVRGTIEP